MDVGDLVAIHKADAEASQVGQDYTGEAEECQTHAAVDWTATTEEDHRVDSNHQKWYLHVDKITDKVAGKRLKDTTVSIEVIVGMLGALIKLFDRFLQLVLVDIEPHVLLGQL